jgi:hypothetical protein
VQMAGANAGQALQKGPLLGLDVSRWLKNPRNEGLATVAGVQTVKLGGDADVARIASDLKGLAQGTPAGMPRVGDVLKRATVTLYTGADDRILRRLVVDADGQGGPVVVDLTFAQVGEDPKIAAPANARPFAELLPLLSDAGVLRQGGAGLRIK